MIQLTTRQSTENLEQALELSNKESNDTFAYVASLEGGVGNLKQESVQAWKNRDSF